METFKELFEASEPTKQKIIDIFDKYMPIDEG